ncbi:MAG: DUF4838 domain-containing protein, partial [Acidobacteria bacterium]|nr:DUF4838 domain-containing protein [Acidobacteriota bacterium]
MRTRTVRPAVLLIGMCLLVTLPLVGCRTGPKKTSAASLVLARNGRAETCIVLGAEAVSAERTAAAELAAYLGKVTGGTFNVVAETEAPTHGMRLYVGPTKAARRQGVRAEALGPEEWVIRTTDDGLVLTGGRPRGTLYAVYRFLEDMVGVHWWNPWEETVPKLPALAVPRVNRRGKPTFLYRDVHGIGAFGDGGRFAARNRLNQQGADLASPSELISPEYGGDVPYGLPYHVHTSYMYVPPEEYFEKHPEWFSLINGERSAKRAQLCLTNQQLREHMVHKLEGYIETSRTEARAAGFPPPLVFDISQ